MWNGTTTARPSESFANLQDKLCGKTVIILSSVFSAENNGTGSRSVHAKVKVASRRNGAGWASKKTGCQY